MRIYRWAVAFIAIVWSSMATAETLAQIQAQRVAAEKQLKTLRDRERAARKMAHQCAPVIAAGGQCGMPDTSDGTRGPSADEPPEQPEVAASQGGKNQATTGTSGTSAPASGTTPISTVPVTVVPLPAADGAPASRLIIITPSAGSGGTGKAAADSDKTDGTGGGTDSGKTKTEEQDRKEAEATRKFGGLELGVGLSYTADMGKRDRVVEAELVNNIVRIKSAANSRTRLMLESHYFFKPMRSFLGVGPEMWGIGPFVAIQGGSNEIIEAIGFGAMMGFRRARDETNSFNIGLGLVVDPNVRVLGDGIKRDMPLPAGETEIRYKQDSQVGIMGIVSFTF